MDRYAKLKLKDLSLLTSSVTPTDEKEENAFKKAEVARKNVTRAIVTARSRSNTPDMFGMPLTSNEKSEKLNED